MIFAIGAGVAVYYLQPYGEQTITQPAPEAVVYAYFPVGKFYLRPGLRLNYSWDHTDSPQAFQVRESDLRYFAEFGVVYNWILLPSFTVGVGVDHRTIHLKAKPPIYVPKDNVSSAENLASTYLQAGVGFPLVHGWIVVEPYARLTFVEGETVRGLGYGIEATLEIF